MLYSKGDLVEVVAEDLAGLPKGIIGEVISVSGHPYPIKVKFPSIEDLWPMNPGELKLVYKT